MVAAVKADRPEKLRMLKAETVYAETARMLGGRGRAVSACPISPKGHVGNTLSAEACRPGVPPLPPTCTVMTRTCWAKPYFFFSVSLSLSVSPFFAINDVVLVFVMRTVRFCCCCKVGGLLVALLLSPIFSLFVSKCPVL